MSNSDDARALLACYARHRKKSPPRMGDVSLGALTSQTREGGKGYAESVQDPRVLRSAKRDEPPLRAGVQWSRPAGGSHPGNAGGGVGAGDRRDPARRGLGDQGRAAWGEARE